MNTIVNLNADNIEQLRKEADRNGEVLEALMGDRHSGPNPRADAIAYAVERMGVEWLERNGPLSTRRLNDIAAIGSVFNWLYLRLIGQDKKLPVNDAWVMHKDQRGAVPLHPTKVMPWMIEARFIDPNGTGTYAITIERLDDDSDCPLGCGE